MATAELDEPLHAAPQDGPPWGAVPGHRDVWPTPLQADLLRATLLADERGLAAWARIRPTLRIAEMDSAVQVLLPALHRNLRALGSEDSMLELFKGVHRYTWARNQLLLAHVVPIIAALERAGFPTLVLKGAALLADGRQNAGMRPMTDIDVLVPTTAAADAAQLLVARGMTPWLNVPLWYVTDYWMPDLMHSCNFTDADGGQLDLHWHAMWCSGQDRADEDLWAAAETVKLRGVATRTLCPADELLLVIVHGLRWASPAPSYRWVLDATLIARGICGEVDYERLIAQSRRHRVTTVVRAGLEYLRRLADVHVPERSLRSMRGPALLQRLEGRAHYKPPTERSGLEQAALYHGRFVRRSVRAGARVTPATHLRLAARRLGLRSLADLRYLRPGGRPGPSRPDADTAAAIGTGSCAPPQLAWGQTLEFRDPDTARQHCLYGLWLPEPSGCWIAGRETRLAFELAQPADSSLLLAISAGGHLAAARRRAVLEVVLDDEPLAKIEFDADRQRVDGEGVVLPRRLVAGRSRLELTLRARDPVAPARLGTVEDTRSIGAYLDRLVLREPRRCSLGERLDFGAGTTDLEMLAGGWAGPDAGGRWTSGPVARVLVRLTGVPSVLEWDAEPIAAPAALPLQVEVECNGARLGSVEYRGGPQRRRLPLPTAEPDGEVAVTWHIRNPRSPSDCGLSDDRRPLGLFFREAVLF